MLRLSAGSFAFTPTYPMPLSGYGRRLDAYEKVDNDLWAVLLLLSDDCGGKIVLGCVDTLFLSATLLSDITNALGDPPVPLCLFATHTHNAPSLAPELPLLGRHDPKWCRSFVSSCAKAISELVGILGEPVVPRYGEQLTDLNVNRRRPAWELDYPALMRHHRVNFGKRITLAANKRGIIDRRVRAVFFENQHGEVRAVVWTLAAHPAFYPAPNNVSPDFPGLIRQALRRQFGKDCAIVYLPGFAGSAIPNIPRRTPTTWTEAAISVLPFYPTLRSFGVKGYQKWVDHLFSEIMRAYEARVPQSPETCVLVDHTSVPSIFRGRSHGSESMVIDLQLSRVTLALGLDILACNGEMLGEWLPLLHPLTSRTAGEVLFSGYLAGAPLYVPTTAQLKEGGYEVEGFKKWFGLEGMFHSDISHLVISATERLFKPGETAGRPVISDPMIPAAQKPDSWGIPKLPWT